jgi:hypothetical protein
VKENWTNERTNERTAHRLPVWSSRSNLKQKKKLEEEEDKKKRKELFEIIFDLSFSSRRCYGAGVLGLNMPAHAESAFQCPTFSYTANGIQHTLLIIWRLLWSLPNCFWFCLVGVFFLLFSIGPHMEMCNFLLDIIS